MAAETEELSKSLNKILNKSADEMRADTNGTLKMMTELLETLTMAVEGMTENGKSLSSASSDAQERFVQAVEKMSIVVKSPQVNVNVDMDAINRNTQSLLRVVEQIQSQNTAIVEAIQKLPSGSHQSAGASDELIKKTLDMLDKSNRFLEQGVKLTDYTADLKRLADAMEKKPKKIEFTRGGNRDQIEGVNIIY